ncbi:hypothetical protein [Candidatus Odyssella acanthamoebae]|nr:hypothetical protein [Candidatus Paracaedibacter acanthamoebae]
MITHPLLASKENIEISIQNFAASNIQINNLSAEDYISQIPMAIKKLINQ